MEELIFNKEFAKKSDPRVISHPKDNSNPNSEKTYLLLVIKKSLDLIINYFYIVLRMKFLIMFCFIDSHLD